MEKILIVEDEFIIAEDLKVTIEDFGYEVIDTIPSADETIQFIEKNKKPDLILLDIKIEGSMNGIQLAKYIRDRYKIPIVFCTAYTDLAINQQEKDLNIPVVRKPFLDYILERTIKNALQNR